jgi:hypothetical protein
MSSALTQRMFGPGVSCLSAPFESICGKNIAAAEPELTCRNRRLFILFTGFAMNVVSISQRSKAIPQLFSL